MSSDAAGAPDNDGPSLNDFIPDPANARLHPERNKATIAASLKQFGGVRSIVVDADNIVRAGNGTMEAAKAAGLKARVIETDGSELVIVKRTDMRGQQAVAYALADNRSAETAQWDQEVLDRTIRDLQSDGFDVDSLGFSSAELDELLDGLEATGGGMMPAEIVPDRPTLSERFILPPFTVLDARQGYWQDRKRQWLSIGIKSELGRGGEAAQAYNDHEWQQKNLGKVQAAKTTASPGGSPRPAMKLGKNGKPIRGDGAGKPLTSPEPQTPAGQPGPIPQPD